MDGNGETIIFNVIQDLVHHPVKTINKKCLFGVPGKHFHQPVFFKIRVIPTCPYSTFFEVFFLPSLPVTKAYFTRLKATKILHKIWHELPSHSPKNILVHSLIWHEFLASVSYTGIVSFQRSIQRIPSWTNQLDAMQQCNMFFLACKIGSSTCNCIGCNKVSYRPSRRWSPLQQKTYYGLEFQI